MAASGGTSPKAKKELTPDQKRTFALLGVLGVLALAAAAIYLPALLSGSGDSEPVAVAPTAITDEIESAPPSPEEGGEAAAPPADAAPAGGPPTSLLGYTPPLNRARPDPFQSFVLISPTPTPVPTLPPPPPAPTPIPPIEIPPPPTINVPRPGEASGNLPPFSPGSGSADGGGFSGSGGVAVPGSGGGSSIGGGGGGFALPPVSIPRLNQVRRAPESPFPPRRATSAGGGGAPPQTAFDKRLSGVIIAGGVRASLEITRGGETVSFVVQPGDTVEGIQVLNIERFTEGGRTVTRMLVRENGQEKYVELRAGPPRTGTGAPGVGEF